MNNFIPKLIKYNKYYNKSGFLVPFARIEDKKKNNYEKYFAVREGINSRLDEIQASILNVKLKYLQYYINRRKEIAKIYDNNLKNYHLTLPKEINNNLHVYYEYVVSLNNRDQVISKLKKKNVYLKVTYRYPVHIMKPYKKFSLKKKKLKKTDFFSKKILSLPTYPGISDKSIYTIIDEIKKLTLR